MASPQSLVHTGYRLVVNTKVGGHAIRGLLLIEAGQNRNLTPELLERLLFSTALFPAFDIPSFCLTYLKRITENTLSTSQKVGRTIEDVLFLHNLAVYEHVLGYESH